MNTPVILIVVSKCTYRVYKKYKKKSICTDSLFFQGGQENFPNVEREFLPPLGITEPKLPRVSNSALNKILRNKSKSSLTKEQKLLKSLVEHCELNGAISPEQFANLEERYEFLRKYKRYLRIKRVLPLACIGSFTSTELQKTVFASALGSRQVALTLPGLIGYSLPAFYFWHLSYYYAPENWKPFCQVAKYTLGFPFIMACLVTDEVTTVAEEKIFGKQIPLDITQTGGTIPSDMGSIEDFKKFLREDLKI